LNSIANNRIYAGRPAEALVPLSEARAILRKLVATGNLGEDPTRNLAENYTETGMALARLGLLREARAELEQGVSVWQRLADEHPTNRSLQWAPVRTSSLLAQVLLKAGRIADAVKTQERGRTTRRRLESAGYVDAFDRDSAA